MTKQLGKQLINSWEWLDAFCLTQRGDCCLACGQHAILVVQIDDFDNITARIGEERTATMLKAMDNLMSEFALEDTLVAKYSDSTYAVILHYLANREEIAEICEEIKEAVRESAKTWTDPISVSIGAAECHHDPDDGYKCAAKLAMTALKQARANHQEYFIAPDVLKPNPYAVAMKCGNCEQW